MSINTFATKQRITRGQVSSQSRAWFSRISLGKEGSNHYIRSQPLRRKREMRGVRGTGLPGKEIHMHDLRMETWQRGREGTGD